MQSHRRGFLILWFQLSTARHTKSQFTNASDTFSSEDGRRLFLKEGAAPVMVIPKGEALSASKGNLDLSGYLSGVNELPLKGALVFLGHDPVPNADIVICSVLYRSAVKELGGDTSCLVTVDGNSLSLSRRYSPLWLLGLSGKVNAVFRCPPRWREVSVRTGKQIEVIDKALDFHFELLEKLIDGGVDAQYGLLAETVFKLQQVKQILISLPKDI